MTVGIGGNDAGLIGVAEECAELDIVRPFGTACKNHYTSGGSDPNVAAINATGPKVAAVIQGIHARAPQAEVMVVGYPDGLPTNGSACWPLVPISAGDITYINSLETSLNTVLRRHRQRQRRQVRGHLHLQHRPRRLQVAGHRLGQRDRPHLRGVPAAPQPSGRAEHGQPGAGGPVTVTPDITDLAVGGIRTLRELTQRIPFGGGILADSLHDAVKGKTIMITGASSGIGEAASLQIGKAGGKLLLVARTKEKLDAVAEAVQDVGGTGFVHTCDLSDSDDVERMAREVLAQHGHVDILVNNAGKSIRRSVDRSYDRFHDYQRTMALNYFAPVKLMLDLLPGDARARQRPHHQHLHDRAADQHAAVRRLPGLQGGARRLQPLHRARGDRRRRAHHHRLHAAGPHADDRAHQDL